MRIKVPLRPRDRRHIEYPALEITPGQRWPEASMQGSGQPSSANGNGPLVAQEKEKE